MDFSLIGTVESLSSTGAGVVRHEGRVIFVPFVIPGEAIEFSISHQAKNFATGQLIKIIKPSKERITPRCGYFGACGGCQLQHMTYEAQLAAKQEMIEAALLRIGKIKYESAISVTPSPQIWSYRNHITLHRRHKRWGFISTDHHALIEIDRCLIYQEEQLNLPVVNKQSPERLRLLKSENPLHINGCTFEFSPEAFLQANPFISQLIYEDVVKHLTQLKPQHLLDLYCGIGITSTLLGKQGIKVTGVEISPVAIEFAKKNAEQLPSHHPTFVCGAIEKNTSVLSQGHAFDAVLLNPPRQGAHASVLEAILAHRPADIVYVSCDPATLARDLRILTQQYHITSIKAYDMFPQTMHVETVVTLRMSFP